MLDMVKQLLGETPERIERELAKLSDQGAALVAEIERLAALEDEPEEGDAVLHALGATRAARNRLAKIDGKIAEARGRLAIARNEARAKLLAELVAACSAAARDYLAEARNAQNKFARLVGTRDALRTAGFEREFLSQPVPPHVGNTALVAPDLLARFEEELNPTQRVPAAVEPRGAPKAVATPSPAVSPAHRAKPTRRPPLRETAAEGQRLVTVIRGLVDDEARGGVQCGDVIAMAADEAVIFVSNGAGDFVTNEATFALNGQMPHREAAE